MTNLRQAARAVRKCETGLLTWRSEYANIMMIEPTGNCSISKICLVFSVKNIHAETFRIGVSEYHLFDCLFNSLFQANNKETSKVRISGTFEGNPPARGGFQHRGTIMQEALPYYDVIIQISITMTPSWAQWRLKSKKSKKTSKLRVTGLCTGDRWIPRTNGQ